jgi:uncharacterized protein
VLHSITIGLALGAVSIPHCAAMCGPLATLACTRSHKRHGAVRYQLGRMLGYPLAGAIAGHVGETVQLVAPGAGTWVALSVAAATACLWLAYRIVRRDDPAPLVTLRAKGPVRSIFTALAPLLPHEPAAFGAASALLPCGALAAALLSAAATAQAQQGAALMLGFAAASGVFLLATKPIAALLAGRGPALLRRSAVLGLVLTAVFLVARPLAALSTQHDAPHEVHCH